MSLNEGGARKPDITLSMRFVLNDLVIDNRLSPQDAETLSLKSRRKDQLDWNPIELIAEEELQDQKGAGGVLTLEVLTLWLCEKSKQLYRRIDPLKIDPQLTT